MPLHGWRPCGGLNPEHVLNQLITGRNRRTRNSPGGALVELAGNPDLRAQLGRAARIRFEERFTEAEVRRRVGSVYAGFGL